MSSSTFHALELGILEIISCSQGGSEEDEDEDERVSSNSDGSSPDDDDDDDDDDCLFDSSAEFRIGVLREFTIPPLLLTELISAIGVEVV